MGMGVPHCNHLEVKKTKEKRKLREKGEEFSVYLNDLYVLLVPLCPHDGVEEPFEKKCVIKRRGGGNGEV